jgi:hypothetical protein
MASLEFGYLALWRRKLHSVKPKSGELLARGLFLLKIGYREVLSRDERDVGCKDPETRFMYLSILLERVTPCSDFSVVLVTLEDVFSLRL